MSGNQSAKGNPAAKRMSNQKLKDKRARSWKQGQERKEARRKAQDARERANRESVDPTPWEQAKARRSARRAAARNEGEAA